MGQLFSMRKVIRILASGAAFVLLALLVLTTETAAEELGFVTAIRNLVRGGWAAMTDSAYFSLLYAGFWLFLGISLCLWVDYFLKRAADSGPPGPMFAIYCIQEPGLIALQDEVRLHSATANLAENSHYHFTLVFEDLKPEPVAHVLADVDGVWMETSSSTRHISIVFRPDDGTVPFNISVSVSASKHSVRKYPPQIGEYQRVSVYDTQTILSVVGVKRRLQSR